MAFDLLKSAKHVRGLSHAEFRVLFYLLDAANNNTFKCFPSIKQIAECTEMAERTVQRHISTLTDRGFFDRVEQRRADGSRAVNCYVFKLAGVVTIGNQEPIEIKAGPDPEEADQQPAKNGRLSSSNPPFATGGGDTGDGTYLRNHNQESISPSPIGEDPPNEGEDLFGEVAATIPDADNPALLPDNVMQAWNALAAQHKGITAIRKLNPTQRKRIVTRAQTERIEGETLADVWQKVFDAIVGDAFLRGESRPGANYAKPFKNYLDYMLRPAIFSKAVSGGYNVEYSGGRPTIDPGSGRHLGPTEQALAGAKQRLQPSRPW